jgi:hypothetical protein
VKKGPSDEPPPSGSVPPRPNESLISDLFRRALESGAKGLNSEALRQLLAELRVPRETLTQLLVQHTLGSVDELKNSVYRTISKELQAVFERTNLAEELVTALSKLSLDVRMEIQFKPRREGEPGLQLRVRERPARKSAASATEPPSSLEQKAEIEE